MHREQILSLKCTPFSPLLLDYKKADLYHLITRLLELFIVPVSNIFSLVYPLKHCQISSQKILYHFSVQLFSRSVMSDSETPWITAHQASLSNTNSQSSLKLMSIEAVIPSSHLILCRPLLLLPTNLPASGSFPISQLFAWGGQSIGVSASASVPPMNTQDWSPLGWTRWISLQSKGPSRVFSNTTVQKYQFFAAQLSSQPTLTSIHDHWKNHSLD